jgi:hypothetical protein
MPGNRGDESARPRNKKKSGRLHGNFDVSFSVVRTLCRLTIHSHIDSKDDTPETGVRAQGEVPLYGTPKRPQTPSGNDWELDCEICRRQGINQVCTHYFGLESFLIFP